MGIQSQLKQISIPTLETLRQNPSIVSSFFAAKWLPESAFWQRETYFIGESAQKTKQEARARFGRVPQNRNRWIGSYDWIALEEQFLSEWETPELDLHKNFQGLNFLLAGYIPGYVSSKWTIPELRALVGTQSQKGFLSSFIQALVGTQSQKDFLSFFVIENSQWDGLPLVNAIGAGNEIGYETGYGQVRYLLPDECGQILDGLLFLSLEGFQERYRRESEKAEPLPWIDWSEEEMLDWLTDCYNEIKDYYENTFRRKRAMLLYLT